MSYLPLQKSLVFYVIFAFLFTACTEEYEGDVKTQSDIVINKVSLSGTVSTSDGLVLSGVEARLRYHNTKVYTQDNGVFYFSSIDETNDMLILKKEGYYDGIYTYAIDDNPQESFILKPKTDENIRLLFTGDLSFARRFMDPASPDRTVELIESDVSGATLKVSDLAGSGQAVIDPVRPLFHSVDFPTVNFESIATRDQSTLDNIHPSKDFAYYSNDLSLPLLKDLNVNFVTLGNNHVYDYNSMGLTDTLQSLDENSIAHSGAGLNVEEAFIPYRTTIKGLPFSFIGATSIRGDKHELLYVAHEHDDSQGDDPFATQGGAANAHDKEKVATVLNQEHALNNFTVYQFHGGIEYTHAPNSVALRLMKNAIDSNASLVVSHHPHTAQGYGKKDGVFMAYGMGNFIFDQDRLDTLLSHILVCDTNRTDTTKAIGYPIFIEDYIPKLLTGDLANRFIRHISEASRNGSQLLETELESDLMVFPYHYQEYMALDSNYTVEKTFITKEVTISDKGYVVVDLRGELNSEYSLSSISSENEELTVSMGRDLLWFGSFEDNDVDTQHYENSIWNFSDAVASSSVAHRGKVSAHIMRDASQVDSALLYFGRRIRTIGDARNEPNKDLSFYGYFKGKNSRPFTIESTYHGSIGDVTFGSTFLHNSQGGTFDWKAIEYPIPMPKDEVLSDDPLIYLSENARALKFYIRMKDTHTKKAHLYVDDLAIINWEEHFSTSEPIQLSTPHAREFLKVEGSKGTYRLKLEFKRYRP